MQKSLYFVLLAVALLSTSSYVWFSKQATGLNLQKPKSRVDKLIDEINSKQNQWFAAKNFHDDFNYKQLCGHKKQAVTQKVVKVMEAATTIPASFDSREQWPNCQSIKSIRNQANCGSCWAFGAAEAMSDRICIHSNQKDQTVISAENLMACCSSCGDGCDGGDLYPSWEYWVNTGLVTGGPKGTKDVCQPYFADCIYNNGQGDVSPNMCPNTEPNTPACSHSCQSSYNVAFNTDKHYGASAYNVPSDVASIQTEIMTNGPVEAAFTVYEDFTQYKGGVYTHVSGQSLGGHAIKVLGWGVLNGVDYWLVANSWTITWGMEGYFLIQRGVDECGIESNVVAGLPKY